MPHLTYFEAIVLGLIQGISELFPVSSLGHSVLIPALIGGSWGRDLDMSADRSPYLTFLVATHVATAVSQVVFYRKDWLRIVTGLFTSIRHRRIATADQKLAWLLVIATIPVGVAGLALEHLFRTAFGRPVPVALFLTLNGAVLLAVEKLRGRSGEQRYDGPVAVGAASRRTGQASGEGQVYVAAGYVGDGRVDPDRAGGHGGGAGALASDARLARLSWKEGLLIGGAQVFALLPGISRSGSTMVAGLLRGLSHEDAVRFAFLLATPVIAAAGVLKLPRLFGPEGHGVVGPILAGSVVAAVASYLSLRFLTRYFETRTLTPFAIYCVIAGLLSLGWLTLAG